MKGNGFLSKALNGWFISSIVSIQSGQPFSPIIGINRSNSGVLQGGQGDRPNINTPALIAKYFNPAVCTSHAGTAMRPATIRASTLRFHTIPTTVITGDPNHWFNPAMFSMPPNCTGPGLTNCSTTIGQLGTAGAIA